MQVHASDIRSSPRPLHWSFPGVRTSRRAITIGDRSFSADVTSVRNSLLEGIRSSTSLVLFRNLLKTTVHTITYPRTKQLTVLTVRDYYWLGIFIVS